MRAGGHATDAEGQSEQQPARKGRRGAAPVAAPPDPPTGTVEKPDRAVSARERGPALGLDQRRCHVVLGSTQLDQIARPGMLPVVLEHGVSDQAGSDYDTEPEQYG